MTKKAAIKKHNVSKFVTPADNSIKWIAASVVITFFVLFPCLQNSFVNLDDPIYILENQNIKSLSTESIKTFFTQPFVGNYQPLTMLGYAVIYKFSELNPFGYHLVSLLLHLACVVFVFLISKSLSRNSITAFICSLLFGIHPLHVESVAWASELKDVLYGVFFLSSIYCYLRYIRRAGSRKYYWLSLFLFALSLLSKAQAVVLPVLLLLIDYFINSRITKKQVLEKIPFFVFSVVFGLLAVKVQSGAGAVQDFAYFPFWQRILFSCYALVNYFYKLIIPIQLSCFYPYPETNDAINTNWVYVSPVILLAIGYLVYRSIKHTRIILFGVLFFLIVISLVLQLIPVGDALIADRYTYIPAIGIFFIAGHYFNKLVAEKRNVLIAICSIYILVLAGLAFVRTKVWKNSIVLFTDAIKYYPEAPILYNNRGAAYSKENNHIAALADFTVIINTKPRYPNALQNRAITYQKLNDKEKALADWNMAAEHFPADKNIYLNRGNIHKQLNNSVAAISDYNKVLEMDPNNLDALNNRAELYNMTGNAQGALNDLSKIISLNTTFAEVYNNRGVVLSQANQLDQAIADFTKAIEINPSFGNA